MNPDDLFLATLDDLAVRASADRSSYDVLQIAALLRKLLLDDTRLIDVVNRSRHLKYRFRANTRQPPNDPGLIFWSIQDGLDPNTAAPFPDNNVQDLTRDRFLALTIIVAEGERLSVADVIGYLANVAGAVHLGSPMTSKERALASLASSVELFGHTPELRSLLAVARVVTAALEPLQRTIEQSSTSTGFG